MPGDSFRCSYGAITAPSHRGSPLLGSRWCGTLAVYFWQVRSFAPVLPLVGVRLLAVRCLCVLDHSEFAD